MDIVIQQIPDEPTQEQPQLQRETTGRGDTLEEAQLDAALQVSAQEHAPLPEEASPQKRRGRPPGSKNKPKIIESIPEAPGEPIVLNEPPLEEEEPPKKRNTAPKKPRAPKAQPAPPPTPHHSQPIPQTPLQVAASMLEILRLEQAERQWRKSELYKSWVK